MSVGSVNHKIEPEKLLTQISTNFINIKIDEFEENILTALELIGKYSNADRCYVFTFNRYNQTMSNEFEWCADDVPSQKDNFKNLPQAIFPWLVGQINNKKLVYVPDVEEIPTKAKSEKAMLGTQDIKSLIAIPIIYEQNVLGYIGFDYLKNYKEWNDEDSNLLQYIGFILANALTRKAADEQSEKTNVLFKLLIEKIRDGIIVEDENGKVLLVNNEFCRLFGLKYQPANLIGISWSSIIDLTKDLHVKPVQFYQRIIQLSEKKERVEGEIIKFKSGKILERDYIPLYYNNKFWGHFRKYKDITPIKRNEEIALDNQSRLDDIFHSLNTSVYSRTLESNHLAYVKNSNVQGFNNLTVKTFYTGPALMSDIIFDEDKEKVIDFISEILKTGYGEIEYRVVNQDGKIRWIYDRCRVIKNDEDLPVRIDGIATDITDKKLIQLALEESEKKYRIVVDNIKEVLFQTDNQGRWTFLNPAWEELTGYTVDEAFDTYFWDYVHPEDKTISYALFRAQKRIKQKSGRHETKYITKSGETRWIEIFIHLLFDKNDKIKGSFGILTDITDRRRAQEQIELRDKAMSAALNGIVITDPNLPDNPIIYCNPAFEKISGYKAEEVMGKNSRFLQGKETNNASIDIIRRAIKEKQSCNVVIKNYRKDGTPFWNSLSISPIVDKNGKLINFVGIQSDITERMHAEAALQESEKKYRSVVENIKEVIFQTDNEGNWTYLNQSWEEITGFSVAESLDTLFLNYVHPDDRERNQKLFEPLVQRKKDYCKHTVRYLTKDGGFRHIEVFARLTLDKNNEIIGTSGTLNDVTERLKAEEGIKQALSKQKELNELKSRFISTVSHEFRTPLTSILASAELLQRYNDKWSSEKKIQTLMRVQDSVEYMNGMISDILTLNKSEAGVTVFNPRDLELISLCKSILEEVKVTSKKDHKFIFESNCKEIYGMFDDKLIRQFIENLLSNALKYSPNGGEIRFSIIKKNTMITLTVSDKGVGISPEDQERLFQPFFRGSNIGNIPGTGLGLSILQKAVELHKGKIIFSSILNKGTTFKITISGEKDEKAINN